MVQFEGMHLGIKVEKSDSYYGRKGKDVDPWLFQVREDLDLNTIPECGHVPYTALLLRGNRALWWREL